MAVANVIVNRAMSRKFPSTICGVVFQNAEKGRYKCQFTFACDGRSDMGNERRAWNRSAQLAEAAFREFQQGKRPGIVPSIGALLPHDRGAAELVVHLQPRRRDRLARLLRGELRPARPLLSCGQPRLEPLEIPLEQRQQVLRCRVVGRRIGPGAARIEHRRVDALRRPAGTASPNTGSCRIGAVIELAD